MNRRQRFAPFISVFILVSIGLATVFIKMETLRMGYEVVRFGRLYKLASNDRESLGVSYAKLIRPERLDQIGKNRLALAKAQKNQVVLMATNGNFAVRQ
jgi:hypothetical protein